MNNPNQTKLKINKALNSLEGMAVGDAFGQSFFIPTNQAQYKISAKIFPTSPWYYTDDTIMGISIVNTLSKYGQIDQDYLAKSFASKYIQEPNRGYGGTAHKILREIHEGTHWKKAASSVFEGMGSMGNGGAMRAAPIGAYFFDDLSRAAKEASASAEVTHSHIEGKAGAIAVAIAAACLSQPNFADNKQSFLETVIDFLPDTTTRSRIIRALKIKRETSISSLINRLGNGTELCSYDTVPVALWFVQQFYNSYENALWNAVSVLGDRDTICAIVGSIVSLFSPIPKNWIDKTESLPDFY